MKTPPDIVHGLEEAPPPVVTVLSGVQHVGLITINLIYPLLVFRVAETPTQAVVALVGGGMLVLAAATLLQALRFGPFGSGFMCPAVFTATYLGPSLIAAKVGGLPLVFGMTVFAGFLEAALAPLLSRLRPIFPPEISGVVIFMIGVSASIAGLRLMLGGEGPPVRSAEWSIATITLATMIILSVWARGMTRMLCALIGLAIGYISGATAGIFDVAQSEAIAAAAWVDLPQLGQVSWSFDLKLAVPFAIAALAATMKALGVITICQRTNDAEWVRPDMSSIKRGVLADGAATVLSGLVGAVGTNTSASNVGLAAMTGVTSRRIAFAIATIFVLLAFVPKLAAVLASMPRSIMIAALLFSMVSVIIQGIQIMSSRLLDARRSLTIALAIVAGIAVDIFPAIAQAAPLAGPLVGSSVGARNRDGARTESAVPPRCEKESASHDRGRGHGPGDHRELLREVRPGMGRASGGDRPRDFRRAATRRDHRRELRAARTDRRSKRASTNSTWTYGCTIRASCSSFRIVVRPIRRFANPRTACGGSPDSSCAAMPTAPAPRSCGAG